MFSTRNVGGVSLFLFGTTFLWLATVYAVSGIDPGGAVRATTGVLATVPLVGCVVATDDLFRRTGWWELATSVLTNRGFDVVMHALGGVAALVLLRVPKLRHRVHGHIAGR